MMIRTLHRWPGLIAAALLIIISLSGAALSVLPMLERLSTPQPGYDLTVADLTTRIIASHPGVEQIKRAPSGRITAYWFVDGTPGAAVIDPITGQDIGSADPSPVQQWLTDLHRALFLDDAGRWTTAAAAAVLLVLALSGIVLVSRRMGGFRRWFAPVRGPMPGRLHVELTRFAVAGLILSSVTALWMTASTFSLVPDQAVDPVLPDVVSGQTGFAPQDMALLADTPVSSLRELTFPYPGDPTDAFTLTTESGIALIDQGNGMVLAQTTPGIWERISETIYMLHTGQGAALLGLILGVMALAVPGMAVTGVLIWLRAPSTTVKLPGNSAADQAETVILVASEGGSTWGFAASLHNALLAAGQTVHTAALPGFAPDKYRRAKRVVIFAATYGEGAAPASCSDVLARMAAMSRPMTMPLTILGFGDRSFPAFCAFAQAMTDLAQARQWPQLLPMATVDRQSAQDFATWGRDFAKAIGTDLRFAPVANSTATQPLRLSARTIYGSDVQAPTAVLRFDLPRRSLWQHLRGTGFATFKAGDLLGIVPEGSTVPRFYSLASSTRDGFAEICVRKQPGGLCSGQLVDLALGQSLRGFVRHNPAFRLNPGKVPVIMISAGTGIGPFAGFIRANRAMRPLHLFFGARRPEGDLLYAPELTQWAKEGQLASLTTAYSRVPGGIYVQDALRRDAARLAKLIAAGAQIMVCGGRDMADGVREALSVILLPMGLSPATMKAEGRYAEDVY